MVRRVVRAVPLLVAIAVVAAGVGFGFGAGADPLPAAAVSFRPESPSPPTLAGAWPYVAPPIKPADFSVGEAGVPDLQLYEFPGVRSTLIEGADTEGFEVVVPVVATDGAWLRILTQVNVSGTRSFVTRDDMTVTSSSSMIVVERSLGRLTLFEGDEVRFAEPVAIGAATTPTPLGAFYVKDVVDTPDDDPAGAAVLRLGAFTDLFDRRPATSVPIIGGTSDPAALGQPVTTGGMAVSNDVAVQLLALVKRGTPVHILP